jgi:hypothetical protein
VVSGANGEFDAPAPEPAGGVVASVRARSTNVSALGAFASMGAAALCLAFSPQVGSDTFTPKLAIILLFGAVGIVPLARLVRANSPLRWPARAAVAFLAVALVSALVSPSPHIGFFGLYLWGTGWLFWLGAAGAFAIGASLGPDDRRWLLAGLLVGAIGNALIAIYQVAAQPYGALSLYEGTQADGVLGNPIHLEALLLGALALILGRTCRNPLRWGAVVLLLSAGIEFSFERFGLLILAMLIMYALRSYGIRRGGVFGLLVAAGYAMAYLSRGSGLGSRVVSGTSDTTFGTRLRIWWEGAHYMVHHPLLGVGPGQLRTAMDSTATLSFFQHVLAGKVLTDGHDIFVEVGVTTGLLGLGLFAAWMFGAASKSARCGFLGFAAAMLAVELVEPLNVAITPLAFLGLGVATAVRLEQSPTSPWSGHRRLATPAEASNEALRPSPRRPYGVVVTGVALCIALFLGVTMVIGDAFEFRGTNSAPGQPFNLAAATDANRLLPYWPDSALEVAQIEAFDSTTATPGASAALEESVHWTAVAESRDSRYPHIWVLLAGAETELKRYGLAHADYLRALSCDKWYTQALQGLGLLASAQHQWETAVHWYALGLETVLLRDPVATAELRGLLDGAEKRAGAAAR